MEQFNISRGSTHTISLTLPADYSLDNAEEIWVTFQQNGKEVFTLRKDDLEVNANVIIVKISQEQSLDFKSGHAKMQLRARLNSGDVIAQQPVTEFIVSEILKDGVI